MIYTPVVEDERSRSDIYSRLLKDRNIFLYGEVNDELAATIIAQLLYLDAEDNTKDINLYINSPGGSISSGMAIFDTMKLIKSPVSTIAIGTAASMGAFLLSAGTKGKRFATPNTNVLIHQPLISGGLKGQVTEIEIYTEHLRKTKEKMKKYLSKFSGQDEEWIKQHTERDFWMDAQETLQYGFIDKVLESDEEE